MFNHGFNPPSNDGIRNPQPMPARVYVASEMPVAASPANVATAAPVQATVYVPGRDSPAVATAVATATVSAPGRDSLYRRHSSSEVDGPAQATTYYDVRRNSIDERNGGYNTSADVFWECSRCTFPNYRTEPTCKGCRSPIPPGLYMDPTPITPAPTPTRPQDMGMHQMNTQMNNLSMGGAVPTGPRPGTGAAAAVSSGAMRVHIPNGMLPGQKIRVRTPDGEEVLRTIPPQSEWHYDGSRPFFRVQFGQSQRSSAPQVSTIASDAAVHTITWPEFHKTVPLVYRHPPVALRSVPHSPLGSAGVPPNGRHKALIIGINYTYSRAKLRGCINDAMNMQRMLQFNGFPDDGSHMLLLTDEFQRGSTYQPTRDNIMLAFAWFMKDVRKGDVLFFHFSGHGGQQPDKTGHEIDGYNETLVPVDFERKGEISDDILWGSLVYHLPEGARLMALMDMCHSGTGLDLPYEYDIKKQRWKEDVNPAHSAGDVVLFSGCEDAQTSADVYGNGKEAGGAMTQAFMGAYERTGMVTYHEFLIAVKAELKKKRYSQRPQLTSSQKFDAESRMFSLGGQSSVGGIPSMIEPNHNPSVGRQKRRHVKPARTGFMWR
mmetsp:Transcript_20928/g.36008  ORF Transcript_20928/g.36008 Transcript_20928/m.36008 type:complete len:602 (+) Transcript_20928:58-1863(+)